MTIFPRWLTVGSICINEHHQLADWGKFLPPASSSCWNLWAIINQGHLLISTRLTHPRKSYVHLTLISIRKSGSVEWIYAGMLHLHKWMSFSPEWNPVTGWLLFMVQIWVIIVIYQGIKVFCFLFICNKDWVCAVSSMFISLSQKAVDLIWCPEISD